MAIFSSPAIDSLYIAFGWFPQSLVKPGTLLRAESKVRESLIQLQLLYRVVGVVSHFSTP